MTTAVLPVSESPGLAGLSPRNSIAIVGYFCERFVHTRMPPGSTPVKSGVSSGSATTVLTAVAETTGIASVLISCLILWEKVDGWNGPGKTPGPERNTVGFLFNNT